jgi:hypothetical protein
MDDFFNVFFIALIPAALLFGLVVLIRFCARDARRRGKSPLWVVLAAVFFFPWGLIAWLIFRPQPLDNRPLRLGPEDHQLR